jgi:hypothetical protein
MLHSITRVNNKFKAAWAFWEIVSLNEIASVTVVKQIYNSSKTWAPDTNSLLSSLALISVNVVILH